LCVLFSRSLVLGRASGATNVPNLGRAPIVSGGGLGKRGVGHHCWRKAIEDSP
jgi:hypothetical protein